jgi:hypothetical protein
MKKIRLKFFLNEMMLKLTSFSMSKLIMPYVQPLLTLPLRIGHEKHPFWICDGLSNFMDFYYMQ